MAGASTILSRSLRELQVSGRQSGADVAQLRWPKGSSFSACGAATSPAGWGGYG